MSVSEMALETFDWKNPFKKNRVKIVKGLANPHEVGGHLYQITKCTKLSK